MDHSGFLGEYVPSCYDNRGMEKASLSRGGDAEVET